MQVHVRSEIDELKSVIVHTPGRELEMMTPDAADELLYDDILNLEAARAQH
ncbi:MAG TPA: arginine deiminase, partial [Caldithrix abyssi]|nr:arginine deiminase [Caldithrix abyssi]